MTDDVWTILKVLEWTTGRFERDGIDTPRLEAQVLLAHSLRCDRVALYTRYDQPLDKPELAAFRELVRRRLDGEPVAYLTGEQEFWSRGFVVDRRVLIPRRDTETLIEVALDHVGDASQSVRIVDLCTGSGAIAVTLAKELENASIVATDVSKDALDVAEANVSRHQVADRVELRHGDLWNAVGEGTFDVVVSNPPYVRHGDIAELSREVRSEPALALDGGVTGLDAITSIATGAASRVNPGGLIAIEHGYEQGPSVSELLRTAGFDDVQTRSDLGGHPRVTFGKKLLPGHGQ